MLTLEEAQTRLIGLATKCSVEEVPTDQALGHRLARDVPAVRTQPASDLSAMDGYAICGDGPWLQTGESRAGAPFEGTLSNSECTRISTGAHLPAGSDRVLIQENASVADNRVRLLEDQKAPEPGQHVRKAGFDFSAGDILLKGGTMIGPPQIALAISGGLGTLPVYAAPTIAVLDSGDELVRLPGEIADHQIPASNGPMLRAMLAPTAGQAKLLGPVPDDLDALAIALKQADDCDIVITSGGASVGDHDLIQQALRDWGAEIDFWKVAIKPGKPLMVATRETGGRVQVILGLPGNPVSSFVTCYLFALPVIRSMMGDSTPLPISETMVSAHVLPAGGARDEFLRAVSDGKTVALVGPQDSSALRSLAISNCLIFRPAGCPRAASGETVQGYWLENGGKRGNLVPHSA
ncbi:molybdopterin molybdotransferase MoeA [Erythrobacter crassostreae]|uniref:Molybdopterin molybdenumtransferase n=1 Tax=Erythrobacter crassostreae TaxID=2828328 RepID=A0A9X1F4Z7_9SPHN|nr:molybdopterin molybdotransferase MoeA [Erythrobacter crassostrea]MBV7260237.1 molybdopterin molybdotransferase MoeA [Erythrobacter crassostrea]